MLQPRGVISFCGVNTYSIPYSVSIVFFWPIFILCKLSCTASWQKQLISLSLSVYLSVSECF